MTYAKTKGQLWSKSFRELFCAGFHCPLEDFEEVVFRRCLHLHAVPFAMFLHRRNPKLFREDFDLIREIADVRDHETFRTELNRFYGRNVRDRSWLRGSFSIRISAKKLLRMKNKLIRSQKLSAGEA